MGTKTGTEIVDRVRRILQDTTSGGSRWLDAELLDWINDGQREVVLLKPNALSVTQDVTLIQGSKQNLPVGGIQLLSVIRNTGGRAIRRIDRDIMDSENPDWHQATQNNIAQHYIFDEDAPDTFYVYPPQTVTPGQIEMVFSTAPTDVAALANTIALNDIYFNALVDYVLYRAYTKDTDYAGNQTRANTHYQAFNNSLGIKVQNEQSSSPNQNPAIQRAVA